MAGLIWPTSLCLLTPGLRSDHDRFPASKGLFMGIIESSIYVRSLEPCLACHKRVNTTITSKSNNISIFIIK